MRPRTTENSCLAQENPRNLAGLFAERSVGGFASSPDVPASALGPRIIDSLHAGCGVERETSGLARRCRNQTFLQEVTEETKKMNKGEEASPSSLRFLPGKIWRLKSSQTCTKGLLRQDFRAQAGFR